MPGPPGLPIFGSLIEFRRDLPHLLLRAYRKYGDICVLRVGSRRVIFVNSPEYVRTVLLDHTDAVEKRSGGGSAKALIIGNGLLNSEGAFHERQRKLCAPAFQPRRIASYDATMAGYAERVQSSWADGSVLDLGEQMNTLTMGIAGKALFDADLLDEADELRRALVMARRFISDQGQSLVRRRIPLSWPTPRNRRFRQAVERLDATIYRMIEERRRSGIDTGDLLSMLLVAQEEGMERMTTQQVRDEAVDLFWAGHETSAIALTWTWYLLAQHPEIYRRLREELDRVLGGRTPTGADIPGLTYTQQVFKEALRIYPPIFAFGRQTERVLRLGEDELPVGSDLMISPYTLHRRTDVFPDPDRFDPDRFAPEEERQRPRLAYLPFGSGPRVCIGAHFAMMEGTLVLATVAQHIRFELVPGQRIVPEAVMTQQAGERVLVTVRRQDGRRQ